jgi:hypothetical protein
MPSLPVSRLKWLGRLWPKPAVSTVFSFHRTFQVYVTHDWYTHALSYE